jgi:hypothetical protein
VHSSCFRRVFVCVGVGVGVSVLCQTPGAVLEPLFHSSNQVAVGRMQISLTEMLNLQVPAAPRASHLLATKSAAHFTISGVV